MVTAKLVSMGVGASTVHVNLSHGRQEDYHGTRGHAKPLQECSFTTMDVTKQLMGDYLHSDINKGTYGDAVQHGLSSGRWKEMKHKKTNLQPPEVQAPISMPRGELKQKMLCIVSAVRLLFLETKDDKAIPAAHLCRTIPMVISQTFHCESVNPTTIPAYGSKSFGISKYLVWDLWCNRYLSWFMRVKRVARCNLPSKME